MGIPRVTDVQAVEEAAYLRVEGYDLKGIASALGIGTTKVEKLLVQARVLGLLLDKPEFGYKNLSSPERLAYLQGLPYVQKLSEKLRNLAPRNELLPNQPGGPKAKASSQRRWSRFADLHVIHRISTAKPEWALELRLGQFGLEAAPIVGKYLRSSNIVGVAWGHTVAIVIQSLRTLPQGAPARIVAVPTCGELIGNPDRAFSSSYLAAELAIACNGSEAEAYSLSGIPAVIAKRFRLKPEWPAIRAFFAEAACYARIFGPGPNGTGALVSSLDTIITSVGTEERPWRMAGVDLCESAGVTKEEFSSLVLGDIGGLLIPHPHLSAEQRERFDFLWSLWTGIQPEHYREVATKAAQCGTPGVIVLAIGKNKAKIIEAAVRRGFVNSVICDKELAWALARRCGSTVPGDA